MAKIGKGILGGFSGKVANIVGYNRKSNSVVAASPIVFDGQVRKRRLANGIIAYNLKNTYETLPSFVQQTWENANYKGLNGIDAFAQYGIDQATEFNFFSVQRAKYLYSTDLEDSNIIQVSNNKISNVTIKLIGYTENEVLRGCNSVEVQVYQQSGALIDSKLAIDMLPGETRTIEINNPSGAVWYSIVCFVTSNPVASPSAPRLYDPRVSWSIPFRF